MRSQFISILIGTFISLCVTYFSYVYIDRQSRNDFLKTDSRFYESLEVIQNRIDDLKMTSRSFKLPTSPIVLIAIDDASIEEIGRWPWSRTTISEISNLVLANGAKSMTYDALFSEPERENPLADQVLGKTIEKYADRMVLGTASSGQYPAQPQPYQDICIGEAFLYLGGDKIVTLNPTFVVDDQTENFDNYQWKQLFENIFGTLSKDIEKQFLENLKKQKLSELSLYQKNALISQKIKVINQYCYAWLTSQDIFLSAGMFPQIFPFYEKTFAEKLDPDKFNSIVAKLKKIKAHPIPQYLGWYSNIPFIQDPSKYTASFNSKMDSDGFIRRYPLFYRAGSKIGSSYIPSLAMQTYLIAKNYRAEVGIVEAESKNEKLVSSFKIFDVDNDKEPLFDVPVDSFSQLRLNYYGPEKSFYYMSAKELLTKDHGLLDVQVRGKKGVLYEKVELSEFFKGKSVVLGATALGIYDIRNTPVQNAMPGPEIHLTALANLMERNFILDVKKPQVVIPVLTLIIGVLFSAVWAWGSAVGSLGIFLVSSVILVFVDYFIYSKKNYMITNWSLFTVFTLTFVTISLYKYFTEERNKSKVRKAFSKYVSPSVVEELLKNEKNLELGGQKKNLTVLFSDLRGFTTFSEKLDAKQLADFLNLYLTRMTEEIYKTKGTVDKFIGDAIMAFYGAPVPYENHASLACRCALQSVKKLAVLNDELKGRNFPLLEMGIGINTGEMSVGNMGSQTIQNYTVMGDSVNLASRLEGLTRVYGNNIVLGQLTYEAVKDQFTCREIDRVIVKGKTTTIKIYDLLYEGPIKTEHTSWLEFYRKGRMHYDQGAFGPALAAFSETALLNPEDRISAYYVLKCQNLIAHPPTETWTGVNYLREK